MKCLSSVCISPYMHRRCSNWCAGIKVENKNCGLVYPVTWVRYELEIKLSYATWSLEFGWIQNSWAKTDIHFDMTMKLEWGDIEFELGLS